MFNPLDILRREDFQEETTNSTIQERPNLKTKEGRVYAVLLKNKKLTKSFESIQNLKNICLDLINKEKLSVDLKEQVEKLTHRTFSLKEYNEEEVCRYIFLGGSIDDAFANDFINRQMEAGKGVKLFLTAYKAAVIYQQQGWINQQDNIKKLQNLLKGVLKAKDESGWTFLHEVCFREDKGFVEAILSCLSDEDKFYLLTQRFQTSDLFSSKELTPLDLVAENKNIDIIKICLQGLSEEQKIELLKVKGADGRTLLHTVCENYAKDILKILLESIPLDRRLELLTQEDEDKITPFLVAAYKADNDINRQLTQTNGIVALILSLLSDEQKKQLLTKTDHTGWTPLYAVCRFGYVDSAISILKNVPKALKIQLIKLRDSGNVTSLHAACWNEHKKVVEEMFKGLSDQEKDDLLTMRTFLEETPLAAACQNKDIIMFLLNNASEQVKIETLSMRDYVGENLLSYLFRSQTDDVFISNLIKVLSKVQVFHLGIQRSIENENFLLLEAEKKGFTQVKTFLKKHYETWDHRSLWEKFTLFESSDFSSNLFNPSWIIQNIDLFLTPEDPNQEGANPVEVAFILNSTPLLIELSKRLGQNEYQKYKNLLLNRYAESKNFFLDAEYFINTDYFAGRDGNTIEAIEPPSIKIKTKTLEGLEILKYYLNKANLNDPTKPGYKEVKDEEVILRPDDLKRYLNSFVEQVQRRVKEKDQLYITIERQLYHVIKKALDEKDTESLIESSLECALAGKYCYARHAAVVRFLYELNIKNSLKTLKETIFDSVLRLTKSLSAEMAQKLYFGDVHALNSILYFLKISSIEDKYIPKDRAKQLFFGRYTPTFFIDSLYQEINSKFSSSDKELAIAQLQELMPKNWTLEEKELEKLFRLDKTTFQGLSKEKKQACFIVSAGYYVNQKITFKGVVELLTLEGFLQKRDLQNAQLEIENTSLA